MYGERWPRFNAASPAIRTSPKVLDLQRVTRSLSIHHEERPEKPEPGMIE